MQNKLKYSIIIPTYNEEGDIENTIRHLLSIDYDNYDIIFVDDSNDNTTNIIRKYICEKLHLIIPEMRRGRSEARNIGIEASECDVVIILNADVLLPTDFISRINIHFQNGLDAVSILSEVENMSNMFARYIELDFKLKIYNGFYEKLVKKFQFFWTEGFSVRKTILMKTSLFPSNKCIPIVAGEDVRLIDELRKYNCNGIYDDSIKIRHIAPSTFSSFWVTRKGRGEGTPQVRAFIDKWSYKKIFFVATLKLMRRLAIVFSMVPLFLRAYKLSRYSNKNKFLEIFVMGYIFIIEQSAMTYGEFSSLLNIYLNRKKI